MLSAFLGFAMATVLQQGDTFRQHLHTEVTVVYVTEDKTLIGAYHPTWLIQEQYNQN